MIHKKDKTNSKLILIKKLIKERKLKMKIEEV